MLKLSPKLKAHAAAQGWCKATDSDETFRKSIGGALFAGKIKASELSKLANDDTAPKPKAAPKPKPKGNGPPADWQKQLADAVAKEVAPLRAELDTHKAANPAAVGYTVPTPAALFSKGNQTRVKNAAEKYEQTTKGANYPMFTSKDGKPRPHPLAGQPATIGAKQLSHPSQLGKAVSSAWVKWCVTHDSGPQGVPAHLRLTDEDRDLCAYAMHEMPFTGFVLGKNTSEDAPGYAVKGVKLGEFERKTLLDDTISGGIEVTPVVFDESIILTPVLFGELFPHVNVINVGRGRRIKSASVTNPTFTSGVNEGTAITPFNTANFVSAFDTAVHTAVGSMLIGLDFEEDSPVDLGGVIIQKYGEKAMEYLERVIAVGNGYNEPLGFLNTSGLVSLQSDNGAGGNPTVNDYEGLMFGVAKQYRTEPGAVTAFVGSDTSYRRARGIPVGESDQRRVFGMEESDYNLFGRPYKVQNNIPNNKLSFINLKRYRMYRRLGLTVKVEAGGRQLVETNQKMLVLRMRFGGQMETANAMAVITDAAA